MNELQVYRHVLLPNAFRIIIPPLTSEFLTIFKNSSLALTIGVVELTVMFIMRIVERRVRVPGMISTS